MQYVKARPVLNVEECDRLSFMPYMFGMILCSQNCRCMHWRKMDARI
jgi:hypothetical protein